MSDQKPHASVETAALAGGGRSCFIRDLLLLAGFCGYLFFFGLSYFGLVGADEPRYAQVAREMLARHDWITPTLGGVAWLEKPVLYYWQAMLSYSVFGVSDWAARVPSAMDAAALVFAVYFFLKRFRRGFELDGALMTASMAAVIAFGRAASTDMPLAAMFAMGLLAWYAWYEIGNKWMLAAFYVLMALGTLAKGPVAPFLAAVVIVLFAITRREFGLVVQTAWIPGVALFCAVTLPWYVAVQVKNPEFFRTFILEHNLARFGTNLYHHKQPFWYYLPVALLGLLPWTMFVIAGIFQQLRTRWVEKREELELQGRSGIFLMMWLAVPIVFFSLSASKLPGYILPALPAGILLLVLYASRYIEEEAQPSIWLVVLHAIVAAALVIPALMLQHIVIYRKMPWGGGIMFADALALVLFIGIFWTLRSQYGMRALRFVTLVPVVLAVAAILRIGAPALDMKLSARPLAMEIARMEDRPIPVAVFKAKREVEYGLAFYRNQIIRRYELGQIPSVEHIVVAPHGSQTEVARRVVGRRVSYLGTFAAQDLDYYWVSADLPRGH